MNTFPYQWQWEGGKTTSRHEATIDVTMFQEHKRINWRGCVHSDQPLYTHTDTLLHLCSPTEKEHYSKLMHITMSWIWVINMTYSLHLSPISSQHKAWNVPLLLNIITISLWQTPERRQIKPCKHGQEISRTLTIDHSTGCGGHSCCVHPTTFRK